MPRHIHFLGICGTAMGAVAAAMRDQGYTVTGSDDNVYPPMSTFLQEKGHHPDERIPRREPARGGGPGSSSETPSPEGIWRSRQS